MRYKDYKGKSGSYRWINKHTNEVIEIVSRNIGKAIKRDMENGYSLDDFNIEVNTYPIPEEVKFEVDIEDDRIKHPKFYKFNNLSKSVLVSIYKLHCDNESEAVSDDFDRLKEIVKERFDYDIRY